MGVIVVANPADEHGQYLADLIESRGHRVVQLSAETMSRGPFTWSPDIGLLVDSANLRSERWAGIWRRSGMVQLGDLDPRYEVFARSEWFDACDGALMELPIAWLTPLQSIRSAELKLVQLSAARRAGIRVPETVVTNDPARAMAFARRFRCIAKPVRYGLVSVNPPRMAWTREVSADDLTSLSGPPIILQRLLVASLHLRVVTVDDACFVAQLSATELDWRSNIDNHGRFVTAGRSVASIVSGPARRLATSLGLAFSSQDWLIDDEGQLYFLDANPNGQWMFVGEEAEQVGIAIVHALEERLNAPDGTTDCRLPQ